MDNRTCAKCGKELRSDNRSGYCHKCRAYAKTTAYSKQENCARSKKNHAEFRLKIAVIKLERGCVDCGYSRYAEALDFDHLSGAEKVKSVALMWGYSWDKVLTEIAKCEVVCSNCHRHRTKVRAESAKAVAAQAAAGVPRATPLIRPPAACGTPSGYKRHLRRRETPCAECRAAIASRRRRERASA
jgi:Zn finger protein HypA/HybF involved in hydrogenase expression